MPDEKTEKAAPPTERVILRREKVLVLPEGLDNEVVKEAQKVIRAADKSAGSALCTDGWIEVGRKPGHSKQNAIEAHAGKAGTPEAKPGVYRAPSVTSWKGGLVYERPPEPLIERSALED